MNEQEIDGLDIPPPSFLDIPPPSFKPRKAEVGPTVMAPVSPEQIQRGEFPEVKQPKPNRYAAQMGPVPFKPQAPEEESYIPTSLDDEVKSLNEAYNQIYAKSDLYTAKVADFENKKRLVSNVEKALADRAKSRINEYALQRIKELKPRTEQERVQMNDLLKAEIDNLANKELQYISDFAKPYRDLQESAASDPVVVAMQGSSASREGFKKTFQPVQQASQIIESYMPMQAGGLSFARRLGATLTGELPGYQKSAQAAAVSNDYDEQLANKYKLKNRINADIARQRGAVIPANWEDQIKQTAVEERIAEVGEAQYLKEKQEFAQAAAVKKKELAEQSEYYLGKAEGMKSGLVQEWGNVKTAGDLYEYITGGIGQTAGLMVPTVAASLVPGVGGTLAVATSLGVVSQFEKGIAYKDAIDAIKTRQEELGQPMTETEIYASSLDKLAADAATEAGLINAGLEYIGTLAIVGKLLPRGVVSNLLGKSLASKAGKAGSIVQRLSQTTGGKIADVSFRAFVEGLTETAQAFVTNYQKFKAAGYSEDDAYNLAAKQDYTEDFVGGLTAGGGIAAATAALTPAEKKANRIETMINSVSDTGNADINQQIDNDANIPYDQKEQVRVPSAEQQGATIIQEGPQPEGRGAETEAGGVLQVSPETPGAQAEVTPEPTVEQTVQQKEDELINVAKQLENIKNPTALDEIVKTIGGNKFVNKFRKKAEGDDEIQRVQSIDEIVNRKPTSRIKIKGNEIIFKDGSSLFDKLISENFSQSEASNIIDTVQRIFPPEYIESYPDSFKFENVEDISSIIEEEYFKRYINEFRNEERIRDNFNKARVFINQLEGATYSNGDLIYTKKSIDFIKNVLDEAEKGNAFVFTKKQLDELGIVKKQDIVNFGSFDLAEAYQKAKQDGSNPELVKAVEDLLSGKPVTPTTQPTGQVTPSQFDVKEKDVLKPRTLSKDLTLFHYSSDPELTREKIDPLRVGVSQMKRKYAGKPEGERPAGFYATLSPNSFYGRLEEAEGVPVPKTGAKTPYAISLSDVNFYDITEEFSPSDRIPQARLKELKDQGVDVVLGRGMVGEPEFIILNQEKITDVKKIDETAKQELVQKYGKTRPKYTTEDISVLKSQVPTAQPAGQVTPQAEVTTADLVDEGLRDLDQLQPVTPEVTPQPVSEMEPQPVVTPEVAEEPIIIDKTTLTNAGYTSDQIKLVENNPDKFGQIDDKIVNLETNEVINPTGSKKPKPRAKKRPKETFAKKSFADLEKAMATPGVKLDELLRTVVGLNNDFSDLAKQLLSLYKSNRNLKIAKFSTQGTPQERRGTFGVYTPKNEVKVFIDKIKKNAQAEAKEANISAEELQAAIEYATSRVLVHEIIHAYTVIQMRNAIPALRYKGQNINALKAYQKSGDNQAIKDLITLYLSARDQVKALETTLATGGKEGAAQINKLLKASYLRSRGTAEYGFTDILEFITETFTNNQFQLLLNALDSPITPNKSMWQSFVDAIKSILKLQTTVNRKVEELPVRGGSLLEGVLRVTPNIIPTEQGFAMGETLGAEDPRASALIKIAQGLINRGARPENVIDKVKELVTQKYNIDVDAYAQDILAGINVRREAVAGPFNADTEVANVATSPYNQILTSQKPDDVSAADFKQQKVEAVADFLRGKATSKEQVQDFALAWNDSNPNNPISRAIANEAWDRLKTARPQPAATTTVKINDMIRTQAQIRAKGKAEGVRETTKQFREKLIKMVQDAIKASNLTRNQINSMLSAVKRVNLFTPGSINKLADRIAKLEADAAYADKVNQAKSLRKELSRLARPKEEKVSNYTALARQFLKVDTDYLTSYTGEGFTGLDPLDAYITAATAIKNGFVNPKLDKYERIIVSQVQEYINHQSDFKNVEQAKELAETADEEEIKLIATDGMSVEEMQKLVDELQMQERAQELQEQLRQLDNPDGILNKLNSVDLNTLNANQLATYIHVSDNIIANEDYSLVDKFSNQILAKERITELKNTLGSVKKQQIIDPLSGLQQITQMLDAVFNVNKLAAIAYDLTGIYDYIAGTARVENRKLAMAKDFENATDKIDSKYPGRPQLRLETEQGKLLILGELGKYTIDSTEHIEKVHENIQRSIDSWKKDDKVFGEKMQKIYDQYKNVKSAEEAIEAFQKNDPHVYEQWKWLTDNVFTKQLLDETALNTNSVHNKGFVPFVNYLPTSLRTMVLKAAPPEPTRTSAKPVQAGTTKEARRTMTAAQAYNFKDYINSIVNSYGETLHDIETSKYLQLFNNIANDPEFSDIIGGDNNRNAIVQRMISTDEVERKMGDRVDLTMRTLNNIAEGVSQIGVSTALGGLDQMALQYPTAALSAMIMLGGDAGLFLAAPSNLNPKILEEVNEILKKQDIAVRGQAHKYDLTSKTINLTARNKIARGLSKIRKGIIKDITLKPLIFSDMSVAQRSFIAFYLKSLRDSGYKEVDVSFLTDIQKTTDPARKRALAYASYMVSNLQVASTTAGRSSFFRDPGNLAIIRKLIFSFAQFPANTKIRMLRAWNKIYSGPKKSEGVQELIAVMGEAATFSTIKIYLLPFYYAAVKAGMEAIAGFESPDEDEEDEDRNKNERKLRTQLLLDAIPFNVGAVGAFGSQWLVNELNYAMSETEARTTAEFLKNMGEDPMFERLQNWSKYNEFYGYGQYGIGMQRYSDIINASMNYFRDDYITLDNGYGEQIIDKDSQELERLAMMNMIIQLSPISLREMRSQMNQIEREQFKKAKERQKEESK